MAKKSNSPAKTRAWNRFAQWVRVKGCLETTGLPFVGRCITCEKKFHISFLDAGHCFPGRGNGRLFQEEVVHPQCRICNRNRNGRHKKYRVIMETRYTVKEVVKWEAEGKQVIHDRDMDFPAIEKKYCERTNELLKTHGRYVSYEDMLKDG